MTMVKEKSTSPIVKSLILCALIGMVYMPIEGIFRLFFGNGGWVHISMWLVGGLCGLAVGSINQIPKFYKLPVILQSVIGSIIVLTIEFLAGCVLNLWLKLGIWDYSNLPLNLMGQVCALFGIFWFLIMPFAIWVEDTFRWLVWREDEYYSLKTIYKEMVTFK